MRSQKGQSLVEFALTLPVVLMLVIGIADFGRAFYSYITMVNAGREAARAASIGFISESQIPSHAVNSFNSIFFLEPKLIEGDVKPLEGSSFFKDNDVKILIEYKMQFYTPFIGGEKTLRNKTVMRVETKKEEVKSD